MSEEAEPTLEDLQNRRQLFRDLIRSLGWEAYVEFLNNQVEARKSQEISIDLVEDDKAFEKLIQLRSERRALMLARDFPTMLIESLTEEIEDESARRNKD